MTEVDALARASEFIAEETVVVADIVAPPLGPGRLLHGCRGRSRLRRARDGCLATAEAGMMMIDRFVSHLYPRGVLRIHVIYARTTFLSDRAGLGKDPR
jgi:hypothetical protein